MVELAEVWPLSCVGDLRIRKGDTSQLRKALQRRKIWISQLTARDSPEICPRTLKPKPDWSLMILIVLGSRLMSSDCSRLFCTEFVVWEIWFFCCSIKFLFFSIRFDIFPRLILDSSLFCFVCHTVHCKRTVHLAFSIIRSPPVFFKFLRSSSAKLKTPSFALFYHHHCHGLVDFSRIVRVFIKYLLVKMSPVSFRTYKKNTFLHF